MQQPELRLPLAPIVDVEVVVVDVAAPALALVLVVVAAVVAAVVAVEEESAAPTFRYGLHSQETGN